MVFNATFNNISVISRRSVLLVEKTGGPGENHRPAASQCTPLPDRDSNSQHQWRQVPIEQVDVNPTTIRSRPVFLISLLGNTVFSCRRVLRSIYITTSSSAVDTKLSEWTKQHNSCNNTWRYMNVSSVVYTVLTTYNALLKVCQ